MQISFLPPLRGRPERLPYNPEAKALQSVNTNSAAVSKIPTP